MLSPTAALFFIALLCAGALLVPLAERLKIPAGIVLILLGFAGSEIATGWLQIDTGIRWHNFHGIIFHLFLPVVVFSSALHLDLAALRREAVPIFLLAVPLLLVSVLVTAALIYFGIGHPDGFPWSVALLAGAILAATDPAAVTAVLQRSGAPERLVVLLEGESLFNDATAVVLFMLLLAVALPHGIAVPWNEAVLEFGYLFFGGIAAGLILGGATRLVLRYSRDARLRTLLTLLCAYGAYLISEYYLHVSGVMATLGAGLVVGAALRGDDGLAGKIWEFISWFAGMLIFLMAGVTVTLTMFADQWLAMLIGAAGVLVARSAVVFGLLGPLSLLPGIAGIPPRQQGVLVWGGVRGTITLALALSLPLELESWYTVQSMAYGVVLFTLFVQATTIAPLARRLNPGTT